jgi:hypothetical protein
VTRPPTPSAIQRRERRLIVETAMLDLAPASEILARVRAAEAENGWPPVSAWTVWSDRRRVERGWRLDSEAKMRRRRAALLARVAATERAATAAGDFAAATASQALQAKVLGMVRPEGLSLAVAVSSAPSTPLPVIAERFLGVLREQFGELPTGEGPQPSVGAGDASSAGALEAQPAGSNPTQGAGPLGKAPDGT